MDIAANFLLFADGQVSDIIKTIALYPSALLVFIPIVAIIMGGIIAITKLVIRHRERMAKIEMGMDPDAQPRTNDDAQNNG